MGKKSRVLMLAALACVLYTSGYARAELCRVQFDARTQKIMQQDGSISTAIDFVVEAWDTELKNPPDFVQSITVVAPDNSTFQMTTTQHWCPYAGDRNYYAVFNASQFKSHNIVGGTYKCTVKDSANKSITAKDIVSLAFLEPPQDIEPGQDSTVFEPLTVKWSAVKGAARYRIRLWNNTTNEPVFWVWQDPLYVTGTEITLPRGTLKPSCNYRIKVEARADLLDTDKRSFSKSITFNTGFWEDLP